VPFIVPGLAELDSEGAARDQHAEAGLVDFRFTSRVLPLATSVDSPLDLEVLALPKLELALREGDGLILAPVFEISHEPLTVFDSVMRGVASYDVR
jgi:hypothetical protein